jgi:superfamily II DNA or RNA helicase
VVANLGARIPVTTSILNRNRGKRAIVFHESVAAARQIAARLATEGHRAAEYHTGLGIVTRQENLFLFSRGQVDVLVTCRALDEGLDVPSTELGVVAASSASVRQRIQRMGRVLRPALNKAHATVATIYGTDVEKNRLLNESLDLVGLAETRWYRATLTQTRS